MFTALRSQYATLNAPPECAGHHWTGTERCDEFVALRLQFVTLDEATGRGVPPAGPSDESPQSVLRIIGGLLCGPYAAAQCDRARARPGVRGFEVAICDLKRIGPPIPFRDLG